MVLVGRASDKQTTFLCLISGCGLVKHYNREQLFSSEQYHFEIESKKMEVTATKQTILQVIREAGRKIGINNLTEDQEQSVYHFIHGHDVLVCLPTGSGKSICYAILPLVFDALLGRTGSMCLVVSPLTALMKDQVSIFDKRGITSAFCGSEQKNADVYRIVRTGKVQLVYITPETLVDNSLHRSMLLESSFKENLIAFVIDEAHCIKTW